MSKQTYRIAVVGASSLLGREIAEELANGPLAAADTVLLDGEAEAGKLEEIAGEPVVLQSLTPASLDGVDVAIFASAADAERHWKTAQQLGAAVVDATATVRDVPVRAPQIPADGPTLDLHRQSLSAAHPVALAVAAVLRALEGTATVTGAFGTVLQPASENGAEALDELHQQTVNLLSFQPLPKERHDTQVAFNLLPRLGEDATARLHERSEAVDLQMDALLGSGTAKPVLQWLQAPVFHGFGIALFVTTATPLTIDQVRNALSPDLFELVAEEDEPASNLSAAGQSNVLAEIRFVRGTTVALWLVADNLRLAAHTAVLCAAELTRMRPLGKVQ